MIRYRYLTQLQPPAPFVHVTLRNPVTGAEEHNVPAQLDTAADRTLLPDTVVVPTVTPDAAAVTVHVLPSVQVCPLTVVAELVSELLPTRPGLPSTMLACMSHCKALTCAIRSYLKITSTRCW